MSAKSSWIWMPHSGHFICGEDCRFHLATYVGGYVVSTVGDLKLDSATRKITGDAVYSDIGLNRKFETMVFRARKATKAEGLCCPWRMESGSELDFAGYNDAPAAYNGHLKLCAKWARRRPA